MGCLACSRVLPLLGILPDPGPPLMIVPSSASPMDQRSPRPVKSISGVGRFQPPPPRPSAPVPPPPARGRVARSAWRRRRARSWNLGTVVVLLSSLQLAQHRRRLGVPGEVGDPEGLEPRLLQSLLSPVGRSAERIREVREDGQGNEVDADERLTARQNTYPSRATKSVRTGLQSVEPTADVELAPPNVER